MTGPETTIAVVCVGAVLNAGVQLGLFSALRADVRRINGTVTQNTADISDLRAEQARLGAICEE